MRNLYTLIIVVAASLSLHAQQYPLFSNYLTNCFGFNPAVTGALDGFEARLMHRSQWAGYSLAPQTTLANASGRLKKMPIGIGATFYKDAAGRLDRTGASGTLAFHQQLTKTTTASLGASFGYFKNVLQSEYRAEVDGDPILANAAQGLWSPDVNIGLYIRHQNLYFGASAPQFLEKILKFQNAPDAQGESVLQRHYYFFAGYKHFLGKMYIEPSAMVKMAPQAPLQWDAGLKYGTGTPLWLGLSYRNKSAAAVMAGFDFSSGLGIAYAYDLTMSNLSKASHSSHEITLTYRMSKCKDKDKDGVCDKDDKCPDEPGKVEKDGCPDKEEQKDKCKDKDGDGICDEEDDCPEVKGPKDNKGCPLNDRDKDGIPDDKDKCPDVPGFKQFDGCPMNDRDNDGIRDDLDKCPDEPGPVSNLGCPLNKNDSDGDGIPDGDDQCPNTHGTKNQAGCPEVSKEEHDALNLAIQNLYFDTDKWVIKPGSKPHLDKLAKVMVNQRQWKVRIAGHADARGSSEHNLTLSKNRAEAVMYYLIARGVKREQLIVEYFGENVPLGDNKTPEGLYANRRTDLEFIFN